VLTKAFIYGNIFNACVLSASLLIAEWFKNKRGPQREVTEFLAELVFLSNVFNGGQ
jgi:hypothetical protein